MNSTSSNKSFNAAFNKALVHLILIRPLLLNPPATQPVLSSQQEELFSATFFERISAYTLGCIGINGAPKQAEKVA